MYDVSVGHSLCWTIDRNLPRDFQVGVPSSIATYGLIVSVGYGIMHFLLGW